MSASSTWNQRRQVRAGLIAKGWQRVITTTTDWRRGSVMLKLDTAHRSGQVLRIIGSDPESLTWLLDDGGLGENSAIPCVTGDGWTRRIVSEAMWRAGQIERNIEDGKV